MLPGHTHLKTCFPAIVPSPQIPPLQVCSGSWARFENEATYWNAGQRAYCPGPPRGMFLQISASCTFHGNVLSKAVAVVVVSVANLQVCVSASARHNRTIRTHRSSCCLLPTTFAFAVCVTVLERTTIALRCIRCTTFQCTLDSPLITYIILCSPRVRTIEGGDHVTMTGHVRAGMRHRSWFQTENYGLLTQQISISMGCALSHMRNSYIHML